MKTALLLSGLIAASTVAAPALAQKKPDAPKCKDHPLLTRLPDYWIQACKEKQFDAFKFNVGKGQNAVEGQFWEIRYQPQPNMTAKPSTLQVLRNAESAITKIGGEVMATDSQRETIKLVKDNKELWVEIWADHTGQYVLTVVQKAAMVQQMTASADIFASGLKATGHVTVDGVFFETGKADLKAESQQAIGEMIKLLKADATLKVYVVGHTDNAGALEGNMRLSQDRAQSVVQALVRGGIDGSRLKAFGSGPYSPVASNDAETGRAKNRRVELVKQ